MLTLKGFVIVVSVMVIMIINMTLILSGSIGVFSGIKMHDYIIVGLGLSMGIFNAIVFMNAVTILINTLKTYGIV